MSDEKDFKEKFEKSTKKIVKESNTKLYPASDKDVAYLQHPVIDKVKPRPKPSKEAGTNSYAKDNQTTIKKLKA